MVDDHSVMCPECGHEFKLSDAGYADILQQVRTREFDVEVGRAVAQVRDVDEAKRRAMAAEYEAGRKALASQYEAERKTLASEYEAKLAKTRSELSQRVAEATADVASQREKYEERISSMEEKHKLELAIKDEQIERYRDFKLRMSTKMVGESLERHCENEFNRLRAGCFPNAEFGKDNDDRLGSKGDFIYRERKDGAELLSIMFEMKNEMDDTEHKHKNEDFFKKLDHDRCEKGCEYAVLVSMLEADSELYNAGIVDVSYRYPKMYVVRPQFFIPIITLLRNASLDSLEYRVALEQERARNIDVAHFESELDAFKDKFARNHDLASRKVDEAVDEIDKAIDRLQKAKTALVSVDRNVRQMGGKLDDLTIRKLTRNNPTMAALFSTDAEYR